MSSKPKALVTGATGLLGRQVLKAFEGAGYDVVGTGFSRASPPKVQKLDIQDPEAVSQLFQEVKYDSFAIASKATRKVPQVVVHCAADRQPDSCTKNPSAARNLNVTATSTLAKLSASHKAFLIYISTDYVFPGRAGEAPYAATCKTEPPNIYGETKAEGEQAVLSQVTSPTSTNDDEPKAIILRVPVLYGETSPKENNAESAVNTIMDALWKANQKRTPETEEEIQNQSVKMDDWAIRYPTNTSDVARVCVDLANLYTSTSSQTKEKPLPMILQFSSEDRMTKYEIMTRFAEVMGLSMEYVIADKDGGKPGPDGTLRPYDCHLSTKELKELGVDVSTVDFVAWWRWYVGAFRR